MTNPGKMHYHASKRQMETFALDSGADLRFQARSNSGVLRGQNEVVCRCPLLSPNPRLEALVQAASTPGRWTTWPQDSHQPKHQAATKLLNFTILMETSRTTPLRSYSSAIKLCASSVNCSNDYIIIFRYNQCRQILSILVTERHAVDAVTSKHMEEMTTES